MNERFEEVNNLLNIFCKDQIAEEKLSDTWINNLLLLRMYSNELVELVREKNE